MPLTSPGTASGRTVTILGSTGSVGGSTLDVISRHPGKYRVYALTAASNAAKLAEQCRLYQPRFAVLAESSAAEWLEAEIRDCCPETRVLSGQTGLCQVSSDEDVDTVMAAIVGAAGLEPTLAAVKAGKRVLLANKEALVMSGDLFMEEVARSSATLLPIDSEHNAIFQCLPEYFAVGEADRAGIHKILLTGSGGPFLNRPLDSFEQITPEEACAHPNWDMGRKISVDSATMMNKGLELIEACRLFGVDVDRIELVVHPQSVVHSMVSYTDGSVLAQMGNPDMRTPIAHALAWPERIDAGVAPLDLTDMAALEFVQPDLQRFPCLKLAYQALEQGGTAPAIINAANEVAVAAFLEGDIGFTRIPELISAALNSMPWQAADTLDAVIEADRQARARVRDLIEACRKPAARSAHV